MYCLWIESPENPIPLLPLCVKKLNHDIEINLPMGDISMTSSPELYEIVFPENFIIHI